MNAKVDRLSSLSDDIIHKIFSFSDTKHAIRTSILSTRWKNTWKSIPHLNFSTVDFTTLSEFPDVVTRVLSSRNNEIELSCVELSLHKDVVNQGFLQKIMNYVSSHNVQKISIIVFGLSKILMSEFPLSLLSSRSIKDLTLIGPAGMGHIRITSSWDLLALTSLHLGNVMFRNKNHDEFGRLFSKCPNLTNLTLSDCEIHGDFTISHFHLSNLTLKGRFWYVNVVAPHLKDLTIVNCQGELMFSTPELSSLMVESEKCFEFSADSLSSLEKVNFHVWRRNIKSWTRIFDAPEIIDVLQLFHNVQYLTLRLELVEVVASNVHLVSHLPSPFANLTSLKIYPEDLYSEEIKMPTEVKNYLLGASPSATFTIFSRQEMKALQNAATAKEKMGKLQMYLEQEKDNINCETTQTDDEGKFVKEKDSQIENCWNDLFEQIKQGGLTINHIFSTLHEIEDLLENVPATQKDMIQARLSSLRAESYIVMKLITTSKAALVPDFVNLL